MGARQYQEDRYVIERIGKTKSGSPVSYYGVFDGHGGFEASQYCADRLSLYIRNEPNFPDGDIGGAMHDSYMKIDEDFIATGKPDGTTVCTCIVVGGEKIYCANTGDSRAIVVKRGGGTFAMSKDHKPGDPDETKRITDLGGTVVYWGRWRVESVLAVSRAVGDSSLMPYITAEPDVVEKDIEEDDLFLVIASDGVWDVLESDRVGKFVFQNTVDEGKTDDELLRWIGRKLCVEAGDCGSGDNVSVVVVDLKK